MQSMNKAIVSGHLGGDPQKKGKATIFSIAVNERWGSGEDRQERTNWFPVVAWNSVGENAAKYLHKGSHVLIEGSLRVNEWEDNGDKKSRVEIVAANIIFLDKKSD